jgi:methyl-accepting chemotaxis protein
MTDETLKLKKEEQEAVELWASGKSMTEAYCIVMRKKGYDIDTLPKQTLNKRVQRFFASDKIKEAMVLSGRNREQRVRQEVEKKLAIKKYTEVAKRVEPKIKEAAEAEKKAEESVKSIDESSEYINNAVDTFSLIYQNIQQTNEMVADMIEKVGEVDAVATDVAAISEEQAASADIILSTSEFLTPQSSEASKTE